jgi:hypothetical protein
MDYRSKYPDLRNWRDKRGSYQIKCPFEWANPTVYEYIAPDNLTTFIGIVGYGDGERNLSTVYLAEASPNCSMRLGMETGDIEIYDYWMSRPWLIEWTSPLIGDSYFSATYINPYQMDQKTLSDLKRPRNDSPLDRKLHALTKLVETEGKRKPGKLPWLQKDLAEFMIVYEQKKAIAKKALKCA